MLGTEIRERIDLMRMQVSAMDRRRIRAVMNGGAEGVRAVLAWGDDGPYDEKDNRLGVDLPTANFMYSGLERQAQKIGRIPTIKTDMIPSKDTSIARKKSEKRARIVRGWDDTSRFEMHFPQMGRWVPGYGFSIHVITERKFGDITIPVPEMRDPYDTYLGWFGPDQQPQEMCVVRRIPIKTVQEMYPHLNITAKGRKFGTGAYIFGDSNWERGTGYSENTTEVVEYINMEGTYMILPEQGNEIVSFMPNPLISGPTFVVTKRFSFDQLQSQYHHVFGLMAMLGKLNLLGLMATEDANFRETNVFGEMDSVEYEKGRDAINFLQPGSRVEKPTGEQVNQSWQAVNILERQFRVVAGYDVQQDGVSPNSFATGAGMEQLQSSADNNVREYQTAIRHSVELIDRKRLEWEDLMHPTAKKNVYWYEGSEDFEETYIPKDDINGDYRTERVYGAMATFDETSKILAGIQLLGARVIDTRSLQEELDGFRNISLINERIIQDQTRDALLASLGQKSAQMDPQADAILYQIFKNPSKIEDIFGDVFDPDEEELMAQQQALAQAQQGAGPPGAGGPPAGPGEGGPPQSVQSILSLIEGEGGGVQSVAKV